MLAAVFISFADVVGSFTPALLLPIVSIIVSVRPRSLTGHMLTID
jgi:hypothetical protein